MNFPFPSKNKLSKEEIAEMLKMSPEAYESFENAYQSIGMKQETDNFLDISIKDIKKENQDALQVPEKLDKICERIVRELLAYSSTMVWKDGCLSVDCFPSVEDLVTLEEIQEFPKEAAPQKGAEKETTVISCIPTRIGYSRLKSGNI